MSASDRDVCDVYRPYLVRKVHNLVSQQIRDYGFPEVPFLQVRLGINHIQSHSLHKAAYKLTSDGEMLTLQKINKLTAAKAWILRVQRVNMLHEFLFILTLLLVFGVLVIDIGTIQVYELALTAVLDSRIQRVGENL